MMLLCICRLHDSRVALVKDCNSCITSQQGILLHRGAACLQLLVSAVHESVAWRQAVGFSGHMFMTSKACFAAERWHLLINVRIAECYTIATLQCSCSMAAMLRSPMLALHCAKQNEGANKLSNMFGRHKSLCTRLGRYASPEVQAASHLPCLASSHQPCSTGQGQSQWPSGARFHQMSSTGSCLA